MFLYHVLWYSPGPLYSGGERIRKMRNILRRVFTVLMAVIMCASLFSIPVKAEEDSSSLEDGSFMVETLFDVNTTKTLGRWDFEYNDSWFKQSATIYNHKLARLSLGMAVSAFRPNLDPASKENPAQHLQSFLQNCQFKNLRTDDYDKSPSLYTVSTVIGYKQLQDEEGNFTLIVVGTCGGGYKNEWLSNFTCGDQDMHVGFSSAAREVYDRIFGYIASNRLNAPRYKIWMSGFSRAGAISNILGKLLVDSNMFSTDTVYTYTFATPRTTKAAQKGQYPNIFNICGKMDPVTQVAFVDWGYGRYGTTFYTPSQQTDSDYFIKAARAGKIHREHFGLDFFNNVEWDTKLRVVLNYLVRLVPTSRIYADHLQDRIIKMWSDKSMSNIMSTLMEIASDEELINDTNKSQANSLLTYLAYTVYGYATNSDIDSKYRSEGATTVGNLAREHTPEVYLSWMFSADDPQDLFTNELQYFRIVISGDVDVAIIGTGKYPGLIKYLNANGQFMDKVIYDDREVFVDPENKPDIFMERNNGEHIILLPRDTSYEIVVFSNKKQTVEMHAIPLTVGYTNSSFNKIHYADLEEGQYDVIHSTGKDDVQVKGDFDIVTGDTFDVVSISKGTSSELAIALEKTNILNLDWRQIILIAYTIPIIVLCLLVFVIIWAVGAHRLRRKKRMGEVELTAKYRRYPAAFVAVSLGLFLVQELLYWLMPQYMVYRSVLKGVIGLLLCLMAYLGYRRKNSRLSFHTVIALAISVAADILINYSFSGGMLLFAIAEGVLVYNYFRHESPEKWQYVLWITGIICSWLIISNSGLNDEMVRQMTAYIVILSALGVLSLNMPKKMRAGALLLIMSNVFLFINEVGQETLLIHVLSLGIYYLAIGFFAFSTRYNDYKRNSEVSEQTAA